MNQTFQSMQIAPQPNTNTALQRTFLRRPSDVVLTLPGYDDPDPTEELVARVDPDAVVKPYWEAWQWRIIRPPYIDKVENDKCKSLSERSMRQLLTRLQLDSHTRYCTLSKRCTTIFTRLANSWSCLLTSTPSCGSMPNPMCMMRSWTCLTR